MVKLVGILNVTPDSFSDGGEYDALSHAEKLIKEGADVIDIGAESTRPGATPLTAAQEWQRLEPVLSKIIHLTHQYKRLVSLDTYHPENAKRAIDLGVDWINDVTGLSNPAMIELARHSATTFVIMHHFKISENPTYVVQQWMKETLTRLEIDPSRIILDPGIGFGKNASQSVDLIQHMELLVPIHKQILVGHSRKSFLNSLYPTISEKRDAETLEVSKLLVQKGVVFLRVHDIALHRLLSTNPR